MSARDGVRAVDIVTGRVFWRYAKGVLWPKGVDRSTGDVFVESTSGELVKMNIRSGKIRWSRTVPDIGNEYSIVPDADAATTALIGSDGMAGISRATGKVRWTKKWPGTCLYDSNAAPVAVAPGTLAVGCNDARDHAAVGFDPATGATRWALRVSQLVAGASRPGDAVEAVGVVSGRLAVAAGDTTDLLDPATGRIVAKRRWKDQTAVALNGELQVSLCEDKKADAVCGFDPATGAELWRSPMSGRIPEVGEGIAVADGRVYVASEVSRNDTVVREPVVFDGRNGKVLGRIPIAGEADYIYGPVTDGIIAIGDTTADLYADRPDIRSTRRLPS